MATDNQGLSYRCSLVADLSLPRCQERLISIPRPQESRVSAPLPAKSKQAAPRGVQPKPTLLAVAVPDFRHVEQTMPSGAHQFGAVPLQQSPRRFADWRGVGQHAEAY